MYRRGGSLVSVALATSLCWTGCGDDSTVGQSSDAPSTSQPSDASTSPPGTASTVSATGSESSVSATEGTATETGTGTSGASTSSTSTGEPKLDVNNIPDGGQGACDGEPEDSPFSYIWISNSPQGTVSKINTFTGVEEGRFMAGPGQPDPSRTSVNLHGDVAVVDRNGGIAKIAAREENCIDANQNGMIDTSTGPDDVKAWGEDECVLWHLPLAASSNRGPRPVAWVGFADEDTCTGYSPHVWVGHYHQTLNKGMFFLLDGMTGEIESLVEHEPWSGNSFGPYGGAVNKEGDFWVLGWQSGPLIRIDYETLEVEHNETPHLPGEWTYGMTVDANGDPWVASQAWIHHFNAETKEWTNIQASGSYRGIMADADGNVWAARNGLCGVAHVDVETKTLMGYVENFGCGVPVGISIDVEGYVWVVDQSASSAFKVDPDNYGVVLTVAGLNSPYTYSDMTGAGLNLVVNPPG